MREKVTAVRLQDFMKALGNSAADSARVFLVGGSSAVLCGWRDSTIDVDLKLIPDRDQLLQTISTLKERLQINVEFASPDHFIPELPSWEDRSPFIQQEGKLTFLHYDFYAQALAKIERGHEVDLIDVKEMIARKLVEADRLVRLFAAIEADLYRYPAIDRQTFRDAVEKAINS